GLDVTVSALHPQSWMDLTIPYWEGPVRITGSHDGRGYLEMTGYQRGRRAQLVPPFVREIGCLADATRKTASVSQSAPRAGHGLERRHAVARRLTEAERCCLSVCVEARAAFFPPGPRALGGIGMMIGYCRLAGDIVPR